MKIGRAVLLFLRSNTHLALLALYIAAMLAALFLTRGTAAPAALTVGYAAGAALLFLSRRGAAEIVHERNEDVDREQERRVAVAADLRERIARLRIADRDVAGAREEFLLLSGRFIEACREQRRYVPQGVHEIELVLENCDSYLRALDEASIRRRYARGAAAPSAGPDAGALGNTDDSAQRIAARTRELIAASSARIRRLNREDLGRGLALEDMDTRGELEGDLQDGGEKKR